MMSSAVTTPNTIKTNLQGDKVRILHSFNPKDKQVAEANDFVEASYSLGVREQRFLDAIFSNIQPGDSGFVVMVVTPKYVAACVGATGKDYYKVAKEVVDAVNLAKWVLRKEGETKGESGFETGSFFDRCFYRDDGLYEVKISVDVRGHYLGLTGNFTTYKIEHRRKFGSQYTGRKHKILKKMQGLRRKSRDYELDEYREKMGVEEGRYKSIGHLKSRVIEPTKNDLDAGDDVTFTYQLITKPGGRKVIGIRIFLVVKSNKKKQAPKQSQLPSRDEKPQEPSFLVQELVEIGYELNGANTLIEKGWGVVEWEHKRMESADDLRERIKNELDFEAYVREKIAAMRPGHGPAFVTSALKYNWTSAEQKAQRKQKRVRNKYAEEDRKRKKEERLFDEERKRLNIMFKGLQAEEQKEINWRTLKDLLSGDRRGPRSDYEREIIEALLRSGRDNLVGNAFLDGLSQTLRTQIKMRRYALLKKDAEDSSATGVD